MNSLRARIALLLIAVIVSVVALATLLSTLAFGPPGPHRTIEPVARQVQLIAALAKDSPAAADFAKFSPNPAPGLRASMMTAWLRDTLRHMGTPIKVDVTLQRPGDPLMLSIPVAGKGYLLMPMPHLPPRGGVWHIFWRWILLMTVAAAAIAIFIAYRMTRPLVLLESAIASVGADASLPHLPERGPGEVRATAQALNRLSARLKSAMESRMRLVAAAGHDLRTPMTRMRLRAEFLDDEERTLWLKDLDELDRIADSAILLVREEVDKPEAELIALDTLLMDIVEEQRSQGLSVVLAPPPRLNVKGSTLALSRALRNLLINAATHGGGATVNLRRAGQSAVVTIDDEGPGIPDALLGQIFEPFFRVDPGRRQKIAGAGLGVTIAKEIVQRAGGDIEIANRTPRGLRQTITLPLAD